MFLHVTLEDNLFGKISAEYQVKSLSLRKADKEGHSNDNIADSDLQFVFDVRFRRRGEMKRRNGSLITQASI